MIELITGDITRIEVDAIVNAANNTLLGGGGVDGAIHHAAGGDLLKECKQLNGCETGQAKVTQAYNLPSRYVIHTVGPIYQDGHTNEAELLRCCYNNCLHAAVSKCVRTIAFPAISCGAYGYPVEEACHIAVDTVSQFMHTHPGMTAYFVCFNEDMKKHYQHALHTI